ncbi:LysR family transcriptional regulator [Marinobacterium lutimaris]|uniref:Transcriptional regulator, LysR family n=1 Tax=Marinobacterium lutimaris TaxID=568106 RepID=A0A1H6DHB5_9GAMM|nr:LysR family transcriptional regulator [Marinobacterium lutimaris]SEG83986.1 transcriptional regulator, LysR family [Marinobacterium lutimaris]
MQEPHFDLNWDDLKFLLVLSREGTLSAAAKTLDTSRVTVKSRITNLESTTGVRLFSQDKTGYVLTQEGRQFAEHALECERHLRLALLDNKKGAAQRMKMRIGVVEGIGNGYLAEKLSHWLKGQNIDFELVSLPKQTRITNREADICVTLEEPEGENIIKRILTPYTLGIYASESYIEEFGPLKGSQDVLDHMWVGYVRDHIFSQRLNYHQELSANLNYSFRGTSMVSQLFATSEGLGLGIFPIYLAGSFNLVRVCPEISFDRQYWISSSSDLHRFPGLMQVWKYLVEICERDRDLFYEGNEGLRVQARA